MRVSRLDVIYRKILLTKFFTKGWGCADDLLRLFEFRKIVSNRELCYELVKPDHRIDIITQHIHSDCKIIEGKFETPFLAHIGISGIGVPEEIRPVFFQMIVPRKWPSNVYRPMCIHLAGTGDHYFWRRRNLMVKPLLQHGIGAIILENPFYGLRKPRDQVRSSLHYVSDIFVMGGCLILECLVLLHWCERLGFGPLGVSGLSMGGHMASLAACSWPKPLVLVPCLSWSTASSVFTEGVMSESINWDMLQTQYLSNKVYCDTLSKSCKIVDSPLACNLSRIPEFGLSELVNENLNLSYVSPHEMMSIIATNSCPAISYKHSSQSVSSEEYSTSPLNLLRGAALFKTSEQMMKIRKRDKEAVWFMRGMMDEFTHLRNFSVPYDPSLVIAVCANSDGYVPRVGVSRLDEIWPGITVKYIDTGHVGAYLWYRKLFRESILEAFEKAKRVVPPPGPYFEY